MDDKHRLPQGPPDIADYQAALKTRSFRNLEAYSDAFIRKHRPELHDYSRKWVSDPLHMWSRQWEYPFVYLELVHQLGEADNRPLRILDAGSGVTFFPFMIGTRFHSAEITCCDSDPLLKNIYDSIGKQEQASIKFALADMGNTSFADDQFDAVYCISVLEHTKGYPDIIREFHRILRPGGLLVITFDVSPDGRYDISISESIRLLQTLQSSFEPTDVDVVSDIVTNNRLNADSLVTTRFIGERNPELLPWRFPLLSSIWGALRNGYLPRSRIKYLTFSCHSFVKS